MRKPQWTSQEEIKFLEGISKKKSLAELSKEHGRTESGLELRLKKIVYENMSKGKTVDVLSKLLNMDKDRINQYYYEYKGFLEKKGGNNIPDAIKKEKVGVIHITPPANQIPIITDKEQMGGEEKKIQDNKDLDKYQAKMAKIRKENKIMTEVIHNVKFRNEINKLIKDGVIDKRFKKFMKKSL
jgi:hypothetical protein